MIRSGRGVYLLALFVLAIAGIVSSLATGGRSDVGLAEIMGVFQPPDARSLGAGVMLDIRLPRTVAAALIGINLALSGLILQAITRNSLASPALLGVNQGAALGMVFGLVLPMFAGVNLSLMAIGGALIAGTITFAIAGGFSGRINGLRLILGGVAVGALAYALVRFTYTLEDDLAQQIIHWNAGDIADMRWPEVKLLAVWTGAGILATCLLAHRLNLMALGHAASQGLGVDPRATLICGALIAACLTGSSVAVAGPIAFVGLVVPHMCRMVFGDDHKLLIPMVIICGTMLMTCADGISKWVNAPFEVPVGVVVALIGAPYFLYQTITAKDLS